jgi:CheY-like chemotaxis protein
MNVAGEELNSQETALAQRSRREELTHIKQQFLASLNHEIRTPLSGILGMIDLLLEGRLPADQREYVQAAKECAECLMGMLESALEYTALAAGETSYQQSEFSVREALEACVGEYRPRIEQKGLCFHYSVEDSVPQILVGDALRVRQIVSRLLGNALKFTSAGSISLRCTRKQTAAAPNLVIEVQDSGIGIPVSELDEIFESFEQVERGMVRSQPGIGLGLSIALKLASLMGGGIEVESRIGEGSTFRCLLPICLPTDSIACEPIAPEVCSQTKRILLAEDNTLSQKVVSHVLGEGGYNFDVVPDGRSAVEAAKARRYDLILMDLQMPTMGGVEASTDIRRLPGYQDTPILAFTAAGPDECRTVCRVHGLQGYLPKPVRQHELLAVVRKHLS